MHTLIKKITRLRTKLCPSELDQAVKKWFQDKGDKTLRLSYPLDRSSVVFDLGGYEGQFTSDIFSKYLCKCYVFEPVNDYYLFIQKRFEQNDMIEVYPFGLSNKDEICPIYIDNDASSTYKEQKIEGRNGIDYISLKCMGDFIKQNGIDHIDLLKVNIEGGEYDLLDYILDENLINIINNLQIQFHNVKIKGGAQFRMENIQRRLQETHELTWSYRPFVWENWTKK